MTREQFVSQLTTIMMGVIVGTAETLGIAMDPDKPIHDAYRPPCRELSLSNVDIVVAIDNTRIYPIPAGTGYLRYQ